MATGDEFHHISVLLEEMVEWIGPVLDEGDVFVDFTLGGGGHSEALLEAVPGIAVVGVDRDAEAIESARDRLHRYGSRVRLVKANFAEVGMVRVHLNGPVKGILYDLGVSSPQLDRPERGFGYRGPAPLDMRMDRSSGLSAAEVVNTYPESRLAGVLSSFGDERFARRIARAIVMRREQSAFEEASDLAAVVKDAIPAATRRSGPHPARRTFQAIRIEVNRELESLEASLPEAIEMTAPGGRIAVIAYHSGEDRIAKRAFAESSRGCTCPPDFPRCVCGKSAVLRVLTRKPVRPQISETQRNPRADSARMRVAEKLEKPGKAQSTKTEKID